MLLMAFLIANGNSFADSWWTILISFGAVKHWLFQIILKMPLLSHSRKKFPAKNLSSLTHVSKERSPAFLKGTAESWAHAAPWHSHPSLVLLLWQCFHTHHTAAKNIKIWNLHSAVKSTTDNTICILKNSQVLTWSCLSTSGSREDCKKSGSD